MMSAAVAGRRGKRVALIDHYHKLGEKIRISGGGRCNFTNIYCGPENFLSQNPRFCRSALVRFGPQQFIALVERHAIRYHEKDRGQLFCDGSATQIIEMLKAECNKSAVRWYMPCRVHDVSRNGNGFALLTDHGRLQAGALIVATGGLTVPKIGATAFGYRLAEQFGLRVVPPRPALVPLRFGTQWMERFGALAGIALQVRTVCSDGQFHDRMLFTHQGLSGPAILQISSYWSDEDVIAIDLLPDIDVSAWLSELRASRQRLDNVLSMRWPKRFAQAWCGAQESARAMSEFSSRELAELASRIGSWTVTPAGTLGYNKAEVTLGGVDTRDLSSRTMASIAVPNLYFVGEVVDVTGQLGGFNFQWAWASGHAAGEAAASARA
jgi:predicted Rossmann fold flavoprotein